jgi:hypothetical protein
MDHVHLATPPAMRAAWTLEAALRSRTADLAGIARVLEQLTRKVMPLRGGCIGWTGYVTPGGHGRISHAGSWAPTHRVAYELFVGPVPGGMQLDHVCHTLDANCPGGDTCLHRRCINPYHLEPVSSRENTLRGRGPSAAAALATHCPQGHAYDEQNTWWEKDRKRHCRTCNRDRQRARRAASLNQAEEALRRVRTGGVR